MGNKKFHKIAKNQLDELEEDLQKALEESKGEKPVLVDKNTLSTMQSYLEHLLYIHGQVTGEKDLGLPPSVPNHLRKQPEDLIDENEEENVGGAE